MNITPIDVDYREDATTAGGLIDYLGADRVRPRIHLEFGDLFWATEQCCYGIELKSVSDFFGSLWSKDSGERLETQLSGLRQFSDVPILGIHGIMWQIGGHYQLLDKGYYVQKGGYLYARGVKRSAMYVASVEGFLASIVQQGVVVIHRDSKDALLAAISAFYTESAKDSKRTFNHYLSGGYYQSKDSKYDQYMNVLMSIKGLGEERAKALLERFRTPAGVFKANEKELLSVTDVGKTTVRKMKEALG